VVSKIPIVISPWMNFLDIHQDELVAKTLEIDMQ
jgi:hypothetical protein